MLWLFMVEFRVSLRNFCEEHPPGQFLEGYHVNISPPDRETRRLRKIIENAPDLVAVLDSEGRITFQNRAFSDLLGYGPDELIGSTAFDLIHPDDVERIVEAFARAVGGGEPEGVEARVRHKDGSWQVMEILGNNLLDDPDIQGFVCTLRDVGLRHDAEAKLRRSEERHRAAMEGSLDSVYFMRAIRDDRGEITDFEFTDVNKRGEDMLNFSRDELIGGRLCVLMPDNLTTGFYEKYKQVLESGVPLDEEFEVPIDGVRARWIHHQIIPFDDGLAFHSRDITDVKESEEQLRQALKMEAIGQLTGGIAHDFNNLLAVVLGNLELLGNRLEGDETASEMIARSISAADRGAILTRRLLAFSRKQMLDSKPTDVHKLLADMLDLLRRTLPESIEIRFAGGDNVWPTLVDSNQLEHAILNLAVNARDAMDDGGTMTIHTSTLHMDAEEASLHEGLAAGDYVVLSVSDTGAGMTPETVAKAFDPFFTTKEVGEGSGLGLSMVFGFVSQSQGTVEIISAPGEGANVRIYLPRAEVMEEEEALAPATSRLPLGQGERVMVVEDDPDVLKFVVMALQSLGYETIEALDGPSALSLLSGGQDIDLLFTDVILPGGMSGPELVNALKESRPALKAVYTSGYAADSVLPEDEQGLEMLHKPYRVLDLGQTIRAALDAVS